MRYKYKEQKKLLGSSTYKMEKSSGYNYLSEILHLAPSNIGGVNICANASPLCIDLCLNTSGRGQMNTVQKSRLNNYNRLTSPFCKLKIRVIFFVLYIYISYFLFARAYCY